MQGQGLPRHMAPLPSHAVTPHHPHGPCTAPTRRPGPLAPTRDVVGVSAAPGVHGPLLADEAAPHKATSWGPRLDGVPGGSATLESARAPRAPRDAPERAPRHPARHLVGWARRASGSQPRAGCAFAPCPSWLLGISDVRAAIST